MSITAFKFALVILLSFFIGVSVLYLHLLSFGVLFILLMNVIVFLRPRYFILTWLVIAGFSSAIHLPGGITSYGVMNMVFLPSLLIKLIAEYPTEIRKYPIVKPYLCFLLIYFVSIWYSPEPHLLLFRKYWSFVVPICMSILITAAFNDTKRIEKYLKITLGFVAITSVLSTIMFALGRWKVSGDFQVDRASGFFAHANLYSMYLNFHFAISMTLAMFLTNRKEKLFYYFVSLILCFALIPTFTKGAYITCFLILTILSFMSIVLKKQANQAISSIVVILAIIILGVIFFKETIIARFANDDTLLWRIDLWKGLLNEVLQRPFLGHGFGSYFHIAGNVLGISSGYSTHSQYFEVLLDVGFIGFLAFLGSYFGMLLFTYRAYKTTQDNFNKAFSLGLIISIVGTLFHCFTESAFFIPMLNLYLWFYFGFLVALVNIERKSHESS